LFTFHEGELIVAQGTYFGGREPGPNNNNDNLFDCLIVNQDRGSNNFLHDASEPEFRQQYFTLVDSPEMIDAMLSSNTVM